MTLPSWNSVKSSPCSRPRALALCVPVLTAAASCSRAQVDPSGVLRGNAQATGDTRRARLDPPLAECAPLGEPSHEQNEIVRWSALAALETNLRITW